MEAGMLPKNELKHQINSIFFTENTENDQKLGLKHSKMEVCWYIDVSSLLFQKSPFIDHNELSTSSMNS